LDSADISCFSGSEILNLIFVDLAVSEFSFRVVDNLAKII
jgi:hypothetical protein